MDIRDTRDVRATRASEPSAPTRGGSESAGEGRRASAESAASLLKPGRVLAAVVEEAPQRGRALLRIGTHLVGAELEDAPPPGRNLLLRVSGSQTSPGGVVLDVLSSGSSPAGSGATSPSSGAPAQASLVRALRTLLASERPIGRLLGDLLGRLAGAGERGSRGGLEALAQRLGAHVWAPGGDGAQVSTLVSGMGLDHEARLAAAFSGGRAGAPSSAELAELATTLKAELLRVLAELPEDAPRDVRQAATRALAGVEAEQLLQLARSEGGDALHYSFPVPDGGAFTTAHLFWDPRWERGARDAAREGDEARLTLGVHFSRTGPVRVDATLGAGGIGVRVSVERAELADRIRADLPALRERLAGERPIQLAVGVAPAQAFQFEEEAAALRYFRDHRLVDVEG